MNLQSSLEEFKTFANFLADETAKITMNYFRQKLDIETKKDENQIVIYEVIGQSITIFLI